VAQQPLDILIRALQETGVIGAMIEALLANSTRYGAGGLADDKSREHSSLLKVLIKVLLLELIK
jgi:hypothetical protein